IGAIGRRWLRAGREQRFLETERIRLIDAASEGNDGVLHRARRQGRLIREWRRDLLTLTGIAPRIRAYRDSLAYLVIWVWPPTKGVLGRGGSQDPGGRID